MSETSEERRLFLEAVDLAIRLQNDPGNPISARMISAWTGRSDAHETAWAKVAAIHGMTGQIFMDRAVRQPKKNSGLSRRKFIALAGYRIGSPRRSEDECRGTETGQPSRWELAYSWAFQRSQA